MIKYLIILSRDCRSDETKTWYGLHDPHKKRIILYRKGKRGMSFDRFLNDDSILKNHIYRKGTSTYELQEGSYETS